MDPWKNTLDFADLSRKGILTHAKTGKRIVYVHGVGWIDYEEHQAAEQRLEAAINDYQKVLNDSTKMDSDTNGDKVKLSVLSIFFFARHSNERVSSSRTKFL